MHGPKCEPAVKGEVLQNDRAGQTGSTVETSKVSTYSANPLEIQSGNAGPTGGNRGLRQEGGAR